MSSVTCTQQDRALFVFVVSYCKWYILKRRLFTVACYFPRKYGVFGMCLGLFCYVNLQNPVPFRFTRCFRLGFSWIGSIRNRYGLSVVGPCRTLIVITGTKQKEKKNPSHLAKLHLTAALADFNAELLVKIINFQFSSSHLPPLCECSIGDKESDVFRKCITEDILAVISYLLTLLLPKQRRDWRWGITEPLSTGVASLITVLSLSMGGGAPLSVFRAFCVGFDAVLTCCSLYISRCPGKMTEFKKKRRCAIVWILIKV